MFKKYTSYSNQCYLYDSETNKFFLLDSQVANRIPDEGESRAISNYTPNYRVALSEDSLKHAAFSGRIPKILALEVTQQCNMRCKYCVYSGSYKYERTHNSRIMSEETFLSVLKRFFRSDVARPQYIGFYGGEPLLCFDRINSFHDQIVQIAPDTKFQITTNGLCLTEQVMDRLIKDDYYMMISFDGLNHDLYRRDLYNKATCNTVLERLAVFRKKNEDFFNKHVRLQVTLSPPYRLKEQAEFFNNNEITANMQMNISFVNGFDTTFFDNQDESGGRTESLRSQCMELARDLYSDYKGKHFQRYFFQKQMNAINDRPMVAISNPLTHGNCEFLLHRGFVDVDGNCYPCERVGNMGYLGNVNSESDNEEYVQKIHEDYDQIVLDNCKNCIISRFCGICTARCREGNRYNIERFKEQCVSERKWFDFLIPLFLSLKEVGCL